MPDAVSPLMVEAGLVYISIRGSRHVLNDVPLTLQVRYSPFPLLAMNRSHDRTVEGHSKI